ncbi:rod shape-determining protein RodA [Prolixibacteraceae bacterium JC049]|nr:rod shape-determining protein RodA [Prolixibacteraceae bacterium JC049]
MIKRNNVWANIDWVTIFIWILLMLLGWVNIYAAVYNEEHQSIFDISQRYGKQLMWIGAAIIIGLGMILVDSKFYVAFAFPLYLFTMLLLVGVLLFGVEVKGARSWFDIGSVRLQPSEFAKFATCLALAKYISRFNFKMHNLKSLASIAVILLIPMGLILLQNDTGSALVYVVFVLMFFREGLSGVVLFFGLLMAVIFIMTLLVPPVNVLIFLLIVGVLAFWIMESSWRKVLRITILMGIAWTAVLGIDLLLGNKLELYHELLIVSLLTALYGMIHAVKAKSGKVALIVGVFIASIVFSNSVNYAFTNILAPHHRSRIEILLGIKSDPLGVEWNVHQSMIAIGSGGVSGKGFLKGTQTKFDFVPEQSTDFIFCTVGEEWGFLGTTIVVIGFLAFFLRLLYLAERQRSVFSRVYGYGVVCILFFHFAVNIAMTIKLAPVIGIPLPFFSYGGSSLWSFTILLFIFLRLDASRLERL